MITSIICRSKCRTSLVAAAVIAVLLGAILIVGRFATANTAPSGTAHTVKIKGMPTQYAVDLPQHRQLHLYLDPDAPGFNGIHVTFFDAHGHELPIAGAFVMTVHGRAGTAVVLTALQEGPGHFYTDFNFGRGPWRLEISATDRQGHALWARVDVDL